MHVVVMINDTTNEVEDVGFHLNYLNALHKAVAYITGNHGSTKSQKRFTYIFKDNSDWNVTKYYIDSDEELHVSAQYGRIPYLDNIREIIETVIDSICAYDSYEPAKFPVKYVPDIEEEEENNNA